MWMLLCAMLVFIMHLGFALLEVGLTRAKNTVNILFKNTMILSIGVLSYALIGFNMMYPDFANNSIIPNILGFSGFGLSNLLSFGDAGLATYAGGKYTYLTDFLFQCMFAATAATIISGAVAERIKINSFLLVITAYVSLVYPFCGSWVWGGGWLSNLNFHDFAGSTIVHSVGGWGALAGVLLLGPRLGKYLPSGASRPIYGHSMPLVTMGAFLLWFGWFGFNGGSVLSADPKLISLVLVNTTLAATAGVIASTIIAKIITGMPDLSMSLNGALAGLVGITASADIVTPLNAVIIGLFAGALVVVSILALDKLRIDDPVGAISVHLTCGVWGTLAVALFGSEPSHTVLVQLLGIVSIGACSFISAFTFFYLVKKTLGLRVSRDEELKGLDISEHGMEAYAGFQTFMTE